MGAEQECTLPDRAHRVEMPPPQPFVHAFKHSLMETFFPDDPFRQFKNQPLLKRLLLVLENFFPILEWSKHYSLSSFKSDLLAGITIASLAIPQGISYAKLGFLPPILGLYSSFVPPIVYALMGSSKDIAVGTMAVASLLTATMLGEVVDLAENPTLYLHLTFTATFIAGVFMTALGLLRLGFIVDLLSHATIIGFMGGASTVVILQQLKGVLGLEHFTHLTDIISVLRSVFSQFHEWRWQTAVLGIFFLVYLTISKYISKKKPKLFWISAMAPLCSVIIGSLFVYLSHAERHHVQVVQLVPSLIVLLIGNLKKGLNPFSVSDLTFGSAYLPTVIKTGIITGVIALAEGIAVGRSFAMFKNYHIDGNKEMIALGAMNIIGSFTSCYITSGPFSKSAVNYNAGCKTAVSNIVMAIAMMIVLLFLTPLFYYTPLVVLSAIIISAMSGLIDYQGAIHLWQVDKYDFIVCMSAYIGVVFRSVETGLMLAVAFSLLRVLLFVVRPKTSVLGNISGSQIYRSMDQYSAACNVPGILILEIAAPIYFANTEYLRERIIRWIDDEEEKLKVKEEISLQYIILNLSAVKNIDSSGISMMKEISKILDRRELKLVLVNPGVDVMKKLNKSKIIEHIGNEWIFLTTGEAVSACSYALHACKAKHFSDSPETSNRGSNNV